MPRPPGIPRTPYLGACTAVALAALLAEPLPAAAQADDGYLGQIICGAFNYAPRGWARLDGQLLSISQNTALFSLLGTTYGGNGVQTIALPDMRGRVMAHQGVGLQGQTRVLGQRGGAETATLTAQNMPAHTHSVAPPASTGVPSSGSPQGAVPALINNGTRTTTLYDGAASATMPMAAQTTGLAGGNQPVQTQSPFLVVNCFIALQGIFPSQN
jgi:microcystin-dependent protein